MVLPLILGAIGAGGLAVSAASNLYTQYNQRKLYAQQEQAYRHLDQGYRRYLSRQGRQINPDRAWTSYYGQYRTLQNNIENSRIGSIGTQAGAIGAGAFMGKSLYRDFGHTSRWL